MLGGLEDKYNAMRYSYFSCWTQLEQKVLAPSFLVVLQRYSGHCCRIECIHPFSDGVLQKGTLHCQVLQESDAL